MRKKIFFVISSFAAGGSERVFWLLCQAFDPLKYEITVVLLNTENNAFSTDLSGIRVIDLKTIKASKSFFPLLKLIRAEKPFAIYSTGSHINMLISFVALFSRVRCLVARSTNIPDERKKFTGIKSKMISWLEVVAYKNFDFLVCQSKEMLSSWAKKSVIDFKKLVVIPNPVMPPQVVRQTVALQPLKKIIVVARLSPVKGHDRLIDMFGELPENYCLTIAGGDGGSQQLIFERIQKLKLQTRVKMIGQINNVCDVISDHTLLVLPSYTEGFPNVILEALSVGVPVVTFRVGGVSDFVINDFNGYIVDQGDTEEFKNCIINASNKNWDHQAIANDIERRYSINNIVEQYEQLLAIS